MTAYLQADTLGFDDRCDNSHLESASGLPHDTDHLVVRTVRSVCAVHLTTNTHHIIPQITMILCRTLLKPHPHLSVYIYSIAHDELVTS